MNSPTAPDLRTVPDAASLHLDQISVRYRIPHERYATLKEHAIRWLERRLRYQDFWALQDVSLTARRGEVVGIIGANGAGKSTLLKVVARVLRPTQGRVWVRGRVAPLLEYGAGFHPELSGRENVFLNGALLGFSRAEMAAKFQRIVDFAEMGEFIDAPLRTYSSGMIARLGFAVATDVEPDLLIVDEVLSVGDTHFQKKSFERIQGFRAAGCTILLVSHNMDQVRALCNQVLWLDHGRVRAQGPAEQIVYTYVAEDARAQGAQLAAQAGPSPEHRWGSRVIEITAVRILNALAEPQHLFQTGDRLVLEMDYCASAPVHAPIFGMAIHRHDGVHVTGPNTSFAGTPLGMVQGKGTITYSIPALPLLEGRYAISVAATNGTDTEIYDYHDRAYPFRVVNDGRAMRERYGLMTLQGTWEHRAG